MCSSWGWGTCSIPTMHMLHHGLRCVIQHWDTIHIMDVIKCVIAAGCESHSSDVCLHVQVCPLEDNWHFTGKLRCFHWMTDHVTWRNCGRATCPAEKKMKEVQGSELSTLCCEILSDKCWYHDPSCLTAWVHNFCRYQMRLRGWEHTNLVRDEWGHLLLS